MYTYVNRTDKCALQCGQHDAFTSEDKYFADIWMAIWVDVGENLVFDMDLFSLYWECPLRHPLDHPCTCDFDRFLAEISNNSTPLAM
jgi:hypothetical protein